MPWPSAAAGGLFGSCRGLLPPEQGLHLLLQMGEAFHGLHEQGAVTVAVPGPALQGIETLQHLLPFPPPGRKGAPCSP